jgi:hypothetical protein
VLHAKSLVLTVTRPRCHAVHSECGVRKGLMDNQELWRCHFLGSYAPWVIYRPSAHRAAFLSECPRALMDQARENLGEATDVGMRPLVEDLLRLPPRRLAWSLTRFRQSSSPVSAAIPRRILPRHPCPLKIEPCSIGAVSNECRRNAMRARSRTRCYDLEG